MKLHSVTIAWIFFTIFLVLTIFGFFTDFLPSGKDFLKTNTVLNFTYLTTAIGFGIVAKLDIGASIFFIRVIGMAYMLISLIGFMGMNIMVGEQWENVVYNNLLTYLQFGLGIILSVSGSVLRTHQNLFLH